MDAREVKAEELWKKDPILTSTTLKEIADILLPTKEDNEKLEKVFKELHQVIQHPPIKGGSYGKGTNLCSRKEIDVVIVHPDYREEGIKVILKNLQHIIKVNFPQAKFSEGTPHAVQFNLDGVDVDLLPAPPLSEETNVSTAFSKKQVDFVKKQKDEYPKFAGSVRILKFWRKLQSFDKKFSPSSYMIEIVLAHVFKMFGRQIDYAEIFVKTLEEFCQLYTVVNNELKPITVMTEKNIKMRGK